VTALVVMGGLDWRTLSLAAVRKAQNRSVQVWPCVAGQSATTSGPSGTSPKGPWSVGTVTTCGLLRMTVSPFRWQGLALAEAPPGGNAPAPELHMPLIPPQRCSCPVAIQLALAGVASAQGHLPPQIPAEILGSRGERDCAGPDPPHSKPVGERFRRSSRGSSSRQVAGRRRLTGRRAARESRPAGRPALRPYHPTSASRMFAQSLPETRFKLDH